MSIFFQRVRSVPQFFLCQVFYAQVDQDDAVNPAVAEQVEDTHNADVTDAVITGLQANTRYHITVAAYTRKGDGMRSKAKIISTKGAGMLHTHHFLHLTHLI